MFLEKAFNVSLRGKYAGKVTSDELNFQSLKTISLHTMDNNLIGIVAGILTSISLLPQLFKMIREKKPGDISLLMFVILLIGLGFWIFYGIGKGDYPIIITNSFSLLTNIIILSLHIIFKAKQSTSTSRISTDNR